jgi:hypothetical protein
MLATGERRDEECGVECATEQSHAHVTQLTQSSIGQSVLHRYQKNYRSKHFCMLHRYQNLYIGNKTPTRLSGSGLGVNASDVSDQVADTAGVSELVVVLLDQRGLFPAR